MSILLDSRKICRGRSRRPHRQDTAHRKAMDAARRIAGDPRSYRVSPRRPCPVCGSEKWCCYDSTSGVTLCPRQPDGALTHNLGRPIRFGELGFLHASARGINSVSICPSTQKKRSRKALPAKLQNYYALPAERLTDAAGELGLPAFALAGFGVGRSGFYFSDEKKYCPTWTWPERTATGDVCGIGHRRRGDGTTKRFQGFRGLIYAGNRQKLRADVIKRGRIIFSEGLTDAVATHAMGEIAIGRPSVSGGINEIAVLLQSLDLPDTVEIVIAGENDRFPDGKTWPGRDLALDAARKLARLLDYHFHVSVIMPPEGIKDLRVAFQSGIRQWGDYFQQAEMLEISDTLQIDCGTFADTCSCPNSCVLKENDAIRTKRDNAINEQGIRNPSARYPIPTHIKEKYASHAWDCPEAHGVAGLEDFSPVLMAATCRKRSCPVCGNYWKLKTYTRFHHYISAHDGQLYSGSISDFDWPGTVKEMRRRARKVGIPLRYVAIRDDDGNLTVLSSVIVGDVARPIEKSEALVLLENGIDTASIDPRPVLSCRDWKPLDKPEVERVRGSCSPTAFCKTVSAWGAGVESGNRFLKCNVAGLFLSPEKTLDTVAQDDFWYEGWLRDEVGDAEADVFHFRSAEQRKRIRIETPDPPPAATCQHPPDRVKESPTFDGFINRQCSVCGESLPCRKGT